MTEVGPSVLRSLSSLDRVALTQTDSVHNLNLLNSWLLLKKLVVAVARRTFAQLYVVLQLRSFLDRASTLNHSSPGNLLIGLLQYTLDGATSGKNPESSTGADAAT